MSRKATQEEWDRQWAKAFEASRKLLKGPHVPWTRAVSVGSDGEAIENIFIQIELYSTVPIGEIRRLIPSEVNGVPVRRWKGGKLVKG